MYTYSKYMSSFFIENILSPYLASMRNKRTAIEYVGYIRILCNQLEKDFLDISEKDATLIFAKWETMMKEGRLNRKTICVRLSCYNSLSSFILEKMKHLLPEFLSPFYKIRRPDVTDHILPSQVPSMSELDAVFSQASSNPMYYLILALGTRACMPATKITQITINSIYKEKGRTYLYLKGTAGDDSDRTILLPSDVAKLLDNYLRTLQVIDSSGHIFYNARGNVLTLKNIDSQISKYVNAAALERNYTLKDFRCRGILEMINAGSDEATIMSYTGLGIMRTRQFYLAKGMLTGCPADLVNFQLKVPETSSGQ